MSDIFISYSSKDSERIQPLVKALEQRGWSVWWDRKIPPGKTYDVVIEEALEAAKCVLVVWTETSVDSSWVKTEASEGEARGILIPILLDMVKIPLAFRRIEAAQLQDWDGVSEDPELDNLLAAVTELCGPPISAKRDRPPVEEAKPEPGVDESLDVETAAVQADAERAAEMLAVAQAVAAEMPERTRTVADEPVDTPKVNVDPAYEKLEQLLAKAEEDQVEDAEEDWLDDADAEAIRLIRHFSGHERIDNEEKANSVPIELLHNLDALYLSYTGESVSVRGWFQLSGTVTDFTKWYSLQTWLEKRLKDG